MAASPYQVRPARLSDLPAYVPLHQAAFAGSMGVELGKRYVTNFLKWFITDPEALNLICEADGRLAGYAFGAPQGYNTRMNRALIGTIALATITHPWLFARSGFLAQLPERLRHLLGRSNKAPSPALSSDEPPRRLFRMVGLGVSPDFRRQGIGQQLIKAYEDEAWARGYEALQLSVYENNSGARALYETCGWKPIKSNGKVVTYQTDRPTV
ncbi:MAG: GNAT family N-acetyltransferase [Anaerolineae bacterium]|nr:GNAT family N-acetyltransferase [Anaerolineae bacterium]